MSLITYMGDSKYWFLVQYVNHVIFSEKNYKFLTITAYFKSHLYNKLATFYIYLSKGDLSWNYCL